MAKKPTKEPNRPITYLSEHTKMIAASIINKSKKVTNISILPFLSKFSIDELA